MFGSWAHQILLAQGLLDEVETTITRDGRKCWIYRHNGGLLYLSQAGQATKPEVFFEKYIEGARHTLSAGSLARLLM
jgi:hypothetical protein